MNLQTLTRLISTQWYWVKMAFRHNSYRKFLSTLKPKGILSVPLERDLSLEPAYTEYTSLMEAHPLNNKMSRWYYNLTLRYVLKYDKFMRLPNVYSMCTRTQMYNLIDCVEDIINNKVPGDLLEAGSWKGGMGILMKEVLRRNNETSRHVWLADAWGQNFPAASTDNDADITPLLNRLFTNSTSRNEVENNFKNLSLYDDKVHLIEGYFSDTLPSIEVEQLAILRLDADMYNSTMDILDNLYDKLSVGGYVIIDDYGVGVCDCKQAINDFRQRHGINDPIHHVDLQCAYWQKTKPMTH